MSCNCPPSKTYPQGVDSLRVQNYKFILNCANIYTKNPPPMSENINDGCVGIEVRTKERNLNKKVYEQKKTMSNCPAMTRRNIVSG